MARQTLFTSRKFLRLCASIGPVPALGHLEWLWSTCYLQASEIIGESLDVEAAARWSGRPGELTAALKSAGFIDELEDGRFQCHDFWDHAPRNVAAQAAREAARKARGQNLSETRAAAGRAGAAKRWKAENSKPEANQADDVATEKQTDSKPAEKMARAIHSGHRSQDTGHRSQEDTSEIFAPADPEPPAQEPPEADLEAPETAPAEVPAEEPEPVPETAPPLPADEPPAAPPPPPKAPRAKYHVADAFAPGTTGRAAIERDFGIFGDELPALLAEIDVDHRREFPGGVGFIGLDRWVRKVLSRLVPQKRDGWGRWKNAPGAKPLPLNTPLHPDREYDKW